MTLARTLAAVAATILISGCGGADSAGGGGGGAAVVEMVRDGAIGAAFGSAGPRKCANKKAPTSGPPSREQAAAYSICGLEGQSSDMLYLVDNVVVTDIGKGRDYNRMEDINMGEIDVSRQVFGIRGHYDHYQCRSLSTTTVVDMGPKYRKGTNCNLRRYTQATGSCYTDTFGDWQCSMSDINARTVENDESAPPA